MLLILATALIALHVKRASTITIFVLVSHTLLALLYAYTIGDRYTGVAISALASFIIGIGVREWVERKSTEKLKKRGTTALAVLLIVCLCFNFLALFMGIENGKALVQQAERKSIEPTASTTPKTKEDVGFGIIPDPMIINPMSGQLTSSAKRALEDQKQEK